LNFEKYTVDNGQKGKRQRVK